MTVLDDYARSFKYFRLQFYEPYAYQRKFHALKGANGEIAKARCLKSGNRIGKTWCGGAETAMHATGIYPDWWEGVRFDLAPHIVCAGVNSYKTRDIIQKQLLGTKDKDDTDLVGTGWIPKHRIKKIERKPGIPGAAEQILVHHEKGTSDILLLGYADGKEKFMGDPFHFCWPDEEPPQEIWSQMVRGTIDTRGYLMATFTPENGMTQIVQLFTLDCPDHYAMLEAGWDDAPHIAGDQEYMARLEKEFPHYEIEMRRSGKALSGSAMIFPTPDNDLKTEAIPIPANWPQIIGVDFGGDHPFACVKLAFDPLGKKKKAYVIDAVKKSRLTISQEASLIKGMGGDKIPVAWPHDGNKLDKQSGKAVADLYRQEGVKMLELCFSNPPEPGEPEGSGGQGVAAGLGKLHWAMSEGRFRVFEHLLDWFKEKNAYHTKTNDFGDTNIFRVNEDLMSATRYAYQSALNADDSFRFARAAKREKDFFRPLKYNLSFVR